MADDKHKKADAKDPYGEFLDAWRKLREDHPAAYTAAAILPISGQVVAAADYAEAMDRGDSLDASLASASAIPGLGLIKHGSKLVPSAYRTAAEMTRVERAIDPVTRKAKPIAKAMAAEQVAEGVPETDISPMDELRAAWAAAHP